ncbi:hypothetical protein [Mangrovibacter yixingensis]|uniref:hypothetical protein n=1 Tax=Mangrovibacter yixingensis TaxID=1529639 RepID=UPI001CFC064B|nr:hypothetical protein [Mangrovibacter yixingensis]
MIKKFNYILVSLVVVLLLVAIVAFANVLLIQYTGHAMEFGSVSDWVSAGSNVVMACAAAYAAYQAKNWFRSKSQQFAFDKSADFFSKLDDVVYEYDIIFQEFRVVNQFIDEPVESFKKIINTIDSLETELIEINKMKNKLIRFNVSFIIPIDETLKSIKQFSNKFSEHLYFSIDHHKSYNPDTEEQSPEYLTKSIENIESLNSLFKAMDRSSKIVRESSKDISLTIKIGQ